MIPNMFERLAGELTAGVEKSDMGKWSGSQSVFGRKRRNIGVWRMYEQIITAHSRRMVCGMGTPGLEAWFRALIGEGLAGW
jgi:hypothetical protein